jgi:hypothetical protein
MTDLGRVVHDAHSGMGYKCRACNQAEGSLGGLAGVEALAAYLRGDS